VQICSKEIKSGDAVHQVMQCCKLCNKLHEINLIHKIIVTHHTHL